MEKKIQLNKGLKINKEAISKLQESQMAQIKGGSGGSGTCNRYSCTCNTGSC